MNHSPLFVASIAVPCLAVSPAAYSAVLDTSFFATGSTTSTYTDGTGGGSPFAFTDGTVGFTAVLTATPTPATGGTAAALEFSNNGAVGVATDGEGGSARSLDKAGEEVTWSVGAITQTSGPASTITFLGFDGLNIRFGNAVDDAGIVNGIAWAALASADETVAVPLSPTLTTAWTGGNFRSNLVSGDFDIVAVPEPASLALVGLGGLAVLGRRRKNG